MNFSTTTIVKVQWALDNGFILEAIEAAEAATAVTDITTQFKLKVFQSAYRRGTPRLKIVRCLKEIVGITTFLLLVFFAQAQQAQTIEVRTMCGLDCWSTTTWTYDSKESRPNLNAFVYTNGSGSEKVYVEYYHSEYGRQYDYYIMWSENDSLCCTSVQHDADIVFDWVPSRREIISRHQ